MYVYDDNDNNNDNNDNRPLNFQAACIFLEGTKGVPRNEGRE